MLASANRYVYRITSHGNARMTDQRKFHFPYVRLHNRKIRHLYTNPTKP